jgi:hypothetical protein
MQRTASRPDDARLQVTPLDATGHHGRVPLLLAVIFGGGIACSYALGRQVSSQQYERVYGRPLDRKWTLVSTLVVWGWFGLGVGLIVLFPHYWWATMAILLIVSWLLFMFVMLRVRRGFRSEPTKPSGFLDAFSRGGRSRG